MNFRDLRADFSTFWKEFGRSKSGMVGLVILVFFVILAFVGPALVPFPGAIDHWRDITFWQDNPSAAPPAWTNWLSSQKGASTQLLSNPKVSDKNLADGVVERTWTFDYDFEADIPPTDIVLKYTGTGHVPTRMTVTRPDGLVAALYNAQVELIPSSEQRFSIVRNAASAVVQFVRGQDEYVAGTMDPAQVRPLRILMSKIEAGMDSKPEIIRGVYTLTVVASILSPDVRIQTPQIVIAGKVSGVMGTDSSKRDILTGIIIGIRWALIIGILTSIVTVIVGVFLGVVGAYFGGAVDWIVTRLYEFVYLLPVLPFLIVISAIFKPSIWTLVIIICLFFWTGPYKPVYSMALQIREETYVEASRALGSSRWRIIIYHVIPILLPYSFAVMALSIPSVIVYEASVSLLGLGDANVVTWGQILHDALGNGAVINNLWWWVVPPGLMIALMGMTFAFLGTALDKILHPKLKTR